MEIKQLPESEFSASWWVKFSDGKSACVHAQDSDHAMSLGAKLAGKEAVAASRIPYPATPRLNVHRYPPTKSCPDGVICPSFCYRPDECKGRTACPQRYSCTE